jgi:hypothetical protein
MAHCSAMAAETLHCSAMAAETLQHLEPECPDNLSQMSSQLKLAPVPMEPIGAVDQYLERVYLSLPTGGRGLQLGSCSHAERIPCNPQCPELPCLDEIDSCPPLVRTRTWNRLGLIGVNTLSDPSGRHLLHRYTSIYPRRQALRAYIQTAIFVDLRQPNRLSCLVENESVSTLYL